jgi:phosphoglycolate phosphatase
VLSEEQIGTMVGDGAATLLKRVFKARGMEPPPDALERYLAIYDGCLLNHTRPYDGVEQMLAAIGQRAALALLTNKPIGATRRILDGLDLARHFSGGAVLGGDGPFPRKPDPTALIHLVSQASATPSSTLMVGDSSIDWRTARAARTGLCLARYGFGFEGVALDELMPEDRIISAPNELLRL